MLDHLGGAIGGKLHLGRRDLSGEQLVAQDASDPAREIVLNTVVAQHPRLAERDAGFEFREVRDDRPGRGVVLRSAIEPLGGLDAGDPVAARAALVSSPALASFETVGLMLARPSLVISPEVAS